MHVAERGGKSKCIRSYDGRHHSGCRPTLKPVLKQSSVVLADPKPFVSHKRGACLVELQATFLYVQKTQFRFYPINDGGKHPRHRGVVQPRGGYKNSNGNRRPSSAR